MIDVQGPPLVKALVAVVVTVFGTMAIVALFALATRRPKTGPPPPAASSSALAGASFFFGLLALLLVVGGLVTSAYAEMADVVGAAPWDAANLRLATTILHFAALLPAAGALAFAIAARSAIGDSKGALRGRALYRLGVLLALSAGTAAVLRLGTPFPPRNAGTAVGDARSGRGPWPEPAFDRGAAARFDRDGDGPSTEA